MSQSGMCRCCGQPLPPKNREGVYLPAMKACIYDFVRDHPGVTLAGIRAHCFPDGTNVNTIRVHVSQINDMLAGTDVQIRADRHGQYPGEYRIVKQAATKRPTRKGANNARSIYARRK
jgi:hypothetical protein